QLRRCGSEARWWTSRAGVHWRTRCVGVRGDRKVAVAGRARGASERVSGRKRRELLKCRQATAADWREGASYACLDRPDDAYRSVGLEWQNPHRLPPEPLVRFAEMLAQAIGDA